MPDLEETHEPMKTENEIAALTEQLDLMRKAPQFYARQIGYNAKTSASNKHKASP